MFTTVLNAHTKKFWKLIVCPSCVYIYIYIYIYIYTHDSTHACMHALISFIYRHYVCQLNLLFMEGLFQAEVYSKSSLKRMTHEKWNNFLLLCVQKLLYWSFCGWSVRVSLVVNLCTWIIIHTEIVDKLFIPVEIVDLSVG